MKAFAIIGLIYLLQGLPGIVALMSNAGIQRGLAATYLACFALGVAGSFAAFKDRPSLFRYFMLWAIGIPSLVYATNDMSLVYPAFFHFPVTFGSTYSSGQFTRFGVDVIPAIMFVFIWYTGRGSRSQTSHAEANDNAS